MSDPALLYPPGVFLPNESRAVVNVEFDSPAEVLVDHGLGGLDAATASVVVTSAPYVASIVVPDDLAPEYDLGSTVYYRVRWRAAGGGAWLLGRIHSFRLAPPPWDRSPWSFTAGGSSAAAAAIEDTAAAFKSDFWPVALATYPRYQDRFHVALGDLLGGMATPAGYWRAARDGVHGFGGSVEKQGDLPVALVLGASEADTADGAAYSRRLRWPLGGAADLPGQQTDARDPSWLERYYYALHGDALLVVLDDQTWPGADGWRMSPAQREWLAEILTAHRSIAWKFLAARGPVLAVDPTGGTDCIAASAPNRTWLLALMKQHGVTALLHGRYHGWSVTTDDAGIFHVCAGFGAALSASSGNWHGEERYARVIVGWDGSRGVPHPRRLTFEITNPVGGAVTRQDVLAPREPTEDPPESSPIPAPPLNHAGGAPENPIVEGMTFRARVAKAAAVAFRQAWITAPGRAGPIAADLTSRVVEAEDSIAVDVEAGADLVPGDPPVLNVLHFTFSDDTEAIAGAWVAARPSAKVTLDGYDPSSPDAPLVWHP